MKQETLLFSLSDLCYAHYQQIAETFRVKTLSTINSATARIRKRMGSDLEFFQTIQKVKKNIDNLILDPYYFSN